MAIRTRALKSLHLEDHSGDAVLVLRALAAEGDALEPRLAPEFNVVRTPAESKSALRSAAERGGPDLIPAEIERAQPLGLLGTHERVHLLAGQLKNSGAPGKGTTVLVQVPLERSRAGVMEAAAAPWGRSPALAL